MKLKTKLISIISAFCLVCIMLVVGIWALHNATFEMGGKIHFTASGVFATISNGTLTNGTHKTSSDAESKLKGFDILINDSQNEINEKSESWRDLQLLFNQSGEDVTISFTITNNHNSGDDKYLNVKIEISQLTKNNASVSAYPTTSSIAPKQSKNFEVRFHIDDPDFDASISGFVLDFKLKHGKAEYAESGGHAWEF